MWEVSQEVVILLVRWAIFLTFLILVIFGPVAFMQLRSFIKRYGLSHEALQERVRLLEEWRRQFVEERHL